MTEPARYCTFHLDDLYLGVDVLHVQEVLRYQEMTPVPLASEEVRGLINLRGEIVTALDLRIVFQLGARDGEDPPMNVVIRGEEGGAVSLLVDAIGDVLEVDPSGYEPPPPTLEGPLQTLVTGVYKLDGQLLLIMDMHASFLH